MNKLRVFEAFSGIGTQHMALKRLGIEFEIVAISETDKHAIKSYEAIHGKARNLGDISKIDKTKVPDHDLFTYSFPCQDVSKDGNLKGFKENSKTRTSMLWEALNIIEYKKPKYLVAENIANLVSVRFEDSFKKYIKRLDDIGYNTYYKIVSALDYVPQNRERVFIVSIRKDVDDGSFEFPTKTKTKSNLRLINFIDDVVDESFYIEDYEKDRLIVREDKDGNPINPVIGDFIRIKNATVQGYLLAKHGDGIDLSYPESKTRRGRVQDSRIQTLMTVPNLGIVLHDGGDTVESFKIRRLTPKEYWKLMDIEDEYFEKAQKVCEKRKLYKQAGNAIVVGVLEEIFRNLLTNEINNDIINT